MNEQTEKNYLNLSVIGIRALEVGIQDDVLHTTKESIDLTEIHIAVLDGWSNALRSERIRRGWVPFDLPIWSEKSAGGYREIISEMSTKTLGALTSLFLAETQRRGIALGTALANPDVAETALEATIRKMVRTDPTQALEAFDSLGRFCAEVAAQVRQQIATPEPVPVPDTEPPSTEPEGALLLPGSIHCSDLQVWVRANPHVHQKHEPLSSQLDCWRWLDMLRREGLESLTRCGLEIRFAHTLGDGTGSRILHPDQTIDWNGFPSDPPMTIAPRPEVEP